jgi:glycosyltransferase involved in cell wall biosynthesis
MRTLHVYSGNLYGGIEAILATIARAQGPRGGHEFALCFSGRLSDELRAAGARVHALAPVRLSRPQTARTARQALAAILKRERFDRVVCHAPWSQAIFGGVARRAGTPLAFWAHDVMTGRHWTERLARRTAPDLAIGNSEYTLSTLPRLYPAVPSTTVYAPVEMPSSPLTAADRRALRASLDTPDTSVVIVQASRAEAWKGHMLLVDALACLRDVPNWVWWQVGGAQRPAEAAFLGEVRETATRRGVGDRVRWLGQRDDVPHVLAAADLHCQANTSPEPFGIAFVEALAAGLPVVTTDMGGAREIVRENCGVLVAPEPHAIAGALGFLIGDGPARARLSEAAPARARALCDPARQLARLGSVLESMTPVEAHA